MVNIYTPPREITALPPDNLIDLFGRLRVSSPETQVQIKQDTDTNRELTSSYGLLSGTGITGVPKDNVFSMVGTGTSAQYVFRSKICGLYQNGKSLIIFFTFNFNGIGSVGETKRVGYYTGNGVTSNLDGIYLEQKDGVVYWVLSNGVVGERQSVPLSLWDNQSIVLDWSKSQIGFISFEYLGVGDIECGFVQDRSLITTHTFSHKNALSSTYMSTPNHFLSYELILNRVDTTRTDFTAICATCLIEGGQQRTGHPFSLTRWTTFSLSVNVITPLIVFRNNVPNHRVLISDFELSISNNASIMIEIYRIDSITGLPASAGVINGVEYWTPTTALTFSGQSLMVTSATQLSRRASSSFNLNQYLETNFNDSAVYYGLAVRSNVNNIAVQPSIVNLILET